MPVDPGAVGAHAPGALGEPGAGFELHRRAEGDVLVPGMRDGVFLAVDGEDAGGLVDGAQGQQLGLDLARDVEFAFYGIAEGAGDSAPVDLALAGLDGGALGVGVLEGFDHVTAGVSAVPVDEGFGQVDGEGLARFGVGPGGVEVDVQVEPIALVELASGGGDRLTCVGDVGEGDRPELDVGVLVGPGGGIAGVDQRCGCDHESCDRADCPSQKRARVFHGYLSLTPWPGGTISPGATDR